MPYRSMLAVAGFCASLLGGTAQAGSSLWERIWLDNVGAAIMNAMNSKDIPNEQTGIADVELSIDAEGHASVLGTQHLCGPPEIDEEMTAALQGLRVPRPPSDAAGRPFRWRVVFAQPVGSSDNSWGVVTRCREARAHA
jgi:hypothetical protein